MTVTSNDMIERDRRRIIKVVFYSTILFALACSLIFALAGDGVVGLGFLSRMTDLVGHAVPAVNNVASQTGYPDVAKLTIASQWIFFPIYLVCLIATQPPWVPLRWKKGASASARRKSVVFVIIFFFVLLWAVASDFGFDGMSVYRGTIFTSDVSVPWMRLPFEGRPGLVFAAFLMPLLEAVVYWCLLLFLGTLIAWIFSLRGNARAP